MFHMASTSHASFVAPTAAWESLHRFQNDGYYGDLSPEILGSPWADNMVSAEEIEDRLLPSDRGRRLKQ